MATKIGEAFVDITARLDKYEKGLTDANAKLNKFGSTTKKSVAGVTNQMGMLSKALPLIGITGFTLLIKKMVDVTKLQQFAEAQLNAVIKSTGGIAGVTSKSVLNLARSIQQASIYGDELVIRSSALLLTFTKIGEDVFPRAQQAIVDMSAAMGTDLKESTIQVGKALNDPILGITALRRVGVQLGTSQDRLVKQMVAVGDIAGAQGIILNELETQFGGVAQAATKTLGGALAQLDNTWGDLLEQTGSGLSETLISSINAFNEQLQDADSLFNSLGTGIGNVIDNFFSLVKVIGDVATAIDSVLGPEVKNLIKLIGEVDISILGLIDNLTTVQHTQVFEEALGEGPKEKAAAQNRIEQTEKQIKAWLKLKEEGRKFTDKMSQLLESPGETEDRIYQERLDEAENFHRKGVLNKKQYLATIAEIEAAHREAEFELNLQSFETYNEAATEFAWALDDMLSVFEDNKIQDIQAREEKDLKALDDKYLKEQDLIKSTIKNKKKQDKALEKLEQKKAEEEQKIKDKADEEEKALRVKQFNRQKAFSMVEAAIATALAVIGFLANPSGPAGVVLAVLAAATGAASIIAIAAQKPPAMASGGIVSGRTFAELGEEGMEMVTPLEGSKGKAARQLFVNDLIDTIGMQSEKIVEPSAEVIEPQGDMTFDVTVNLGTDQFYATITQAIENRNILIDERSLVKR